MSNDVCRIILNAADKDVAACAGTTAAEQDVKILNPWNPRNKEIQPQDAIGILKRYGWKGRFRDFGIFSQACVHTSYVDKPDAIETEGNQIVTLAPRPENCLPLRQKDNEELEFLGDRVIGLVVATYLTQRYAGQGEGFMTRVLSRIVNNKQLGVLAAKIGLAPWVIMSRHMEEVCSGRKNLRILGSAFEAWIGAIYGQETEVGRGFQTCSDFIVNVLEKHIDFVQIITDDTNYKDQLLRLFQGRFHVPPRYMEVHVEGPIHDRIFTMGVVGPDGEIIATATGRNKKMAEQEASRLALDLLA
jgi:ribonuclease-3